MTNEELAYAIEAAYARATAENSERGKLMLVHLKELLSIQLARAMAVQTTLPTWQETKFQKNPAGSTINV